MITTQGPSIKWSLITTMTMIWKLLDCHKLIARIEDNGVRTKGHRTKGHKNATLGQKATRTKGHDDKRPRGQKATGQKATTLVFTRATLC